MDIEQKLVIHGRLPGLNEMTGEALKSRFAYAKMKKQCTLLVFNIAAYQGMQPYEDPVHIHFDWYEPNARRDVGNIRTGEKFISDGLVKAGVLKNDTQKRVPSMSDSFHTDKKNPRIEITLTPQEVDG